MRGFLIPIQGGAVVEFKVPEDHETSAEAEAACPACKARPLRFAGQRRRIAADDRAYEADGRCLDCGAPVGVIRVEPSTIFGLTEDEAVLVNGRARVY